MSWLSDLVTGVDGTTHDLGRWSWIGSHIGVHLATIGLFVTGHPPTLMEYSGAHVAVATGHAGALFVKQQTEPK